MSWRIVSASVVGTSHQSRQEPCQDFHKAATWNAPDGSEYLIVVVANGAGSASFAQEGAQIACQKGKALIEEFLENLTDAYPNREEVVRWINEVREKIVSQATLTEVNVREYACTLLMAVIGAKFSLFVQIGDGGIVASRNGLLQAALWPENGEYANETHFLTDENAWEHLQYVLWENSTTELAVFSDGLQRLALVYENRTVYAPFFTPMLATIRQVAAESCAMLNDQLAIFLNSSRVNERTDDDKTLVLAIYQDN